MDEQLAIGIIAIGTFEQSQNKVGIYWKVVRTLL